MKIDGIQGGNNYPIQTSGIGQGSQKQPMVTGQGQEKQANERQFSEEKVIKAVEKANKSFEPFDRRFEISIHEKTKNIMVKVIDSARDEVIREIPSEKLLDMVAHMLEVAGILVDQRV
ncbi:flagellar protein FlaG [Alkaliphilus transvaalensis]|uniref:flagellar protein FlaG n=1 Tax=Alkaliphilus transvaalensis TaxID=114628 RepID=UPI00068554A0|nr:flagellar protein FlaG [Alkaliphilus transvaalensis]